MQESFGARMRQWREQLDIPLATVAEQTKIKLAVLDALERDDFSRWPTGIFRRSFVRAYASAIGLDADVCVRDFLACHPEPVDAAARDFTSPEEIEAPPTLFRQALGAALGSLFHRRRAHDHRHDAERRQSASHEPAVPDYAAAKVPGNPAVGRKTSTQADVPGTQTIAAPAVPSPPTSIEAGRRKPTKVDAPPAERRIGIGSGPLHSDDPSAVERASAAERPAPDEDGAVARIRLTLDTPQLHSNEHGVDTPISSNDRPSTVTSGRVVSLSAGSAATPSPVDQPDVAPAGAVMSPGSVASSAVPDDAPPSHLVAEAVANADRKSRASDSVILDDIISDGVIPQSVIPEVALSGSAASRVVDKDGASQRTNNQAESAPPASMAPAGPDLLAAAHLCTALGQVSGLGEAAELLEDVVRILDAKGVIVWVLDPDSDELTPVLAHGYPYRLLAQLPNVGRDDDNATAAAFRSMETSIVTGSASASGALVLPLNAPGGCAGVLALELKNELVQNDMVRAVATIFAAQLARVVDLAYPALMADRKLA